jgi:hypothetical protein
MKDVVTELTELTTIVRTHVVDPHERGGRFGEDVLSVKCRFCGTVWTDERAFSAARVGDQPCPAR